VRIVVQLLQSYKESERKKKKPKKKTPFACKSPRNAFHLSRSSFWLSSACLSHASKRSLA
jgi:hypothetical protein